MVLPEGAQRWCLQLLPPLPQHSHDSLVFHVLPWETSTTRETLQSWCRRCSGCGGAGVLSTGRQGAAWWQPPQSSQHQHPSGSASTQQAVPPGDRRGILCFLGAGWGCCASQGKDEGAVLPGGGTGMPCCLGFQQLAAQ